jgi:hypothetical protein
LSGGIYRRKRTLEKVVGPDKVLFFSFRYERKISSGLGEGEYRKGRLSQPLGHVELF